MTWRMMVACLAALGFSSLACSKDGGDGTVTVELDGLPNLEARVPKGTRVAKNAMGVGVMLKGPEVSMTIAASQSVDPSDLAAAKKNAEEYAPKEVAGEDLPDGFILTYESTGDTGTTYWLVGRREIEGVSYSCGVRSPKQAHQQSAITICKSLEK